jgi:hypothetical protein
MASEAKPSSIFRKPEIASAPAAPRNDKPKPPAEDKPPAFAETNLDGWNDWITDVAQIRDALAAALEESRPALTGKILVLTFSKPFHEQMVTRSLEALKPSLAKHFGPGVTIETRLVAAPAPAAAAKSSLETIPTTKAEREEMQSADWDDVATEKVGSDIQKALRHFPGGLKKERT